jgi:predicted lipid-binding transport protein (Tim44 family)
MKDDLKGGVLMFKMKMGTMLSIRTVAVFVFLLFIVGLCFSNANDVFADDMYVYPQKGQSNKQMEKDKYECYGWAKKKTGFDPMAAPTATAPPPAQEAPKGGLLRGAGRGALGGLAIGAIAGDAGKGAAIGAASGAMIGGIRRSEQVKQEDQAQQQWAQNKASQYAHNRSEYNRAYSACLGGRGYTVK